MLVTHQVNITALTGVFPRSGEIVVADIGIPPELADDVPLEMATPERIRAWLPERPRSAHKGTFGRALIVAGSVNYVGAAALAGAGATLLIARFGREEG